MHMDRCASRERNHAKTTHGENMPDQLSPERILQTGLGFWG